LPRPKLSSLGLGTRSAVYGRENFTRQVGRNGRMGWLVGNWGGGQDRTTYIGGDGGG